MFAATATYAQSDSVKKHAVFIELLGSGGFGSINYENQFLTKPKFALTFRTGLSVAPIDKNNGAGIVFPVMVNVLFGKGPHKLEFGLGQGITVTTRGSFFTLTTAVAGYRFQRKDRPWFYRATYTPLISYLVDFQVQQWGGLSIGYSFGKKAK